MAGSNEINNIDKEAPKSQEFDKQKEAKDGVRKTAKNEAGLNGTPLPEQLSKRPTVKINASEKDVSDSLPDATKAKVFALADKNINRSQSEYKGNNNLRWDLATYTTSYGPDYKPMINVLVKGNTETIVQSFPLGSFDADKKIAFQAPFDSLPPLDDSDRDSLNGLFA